MKDLSEGMWNGIADELKVNDGNISPKKIIPVLFSFSLSFIFFFFLLKKTQILKSLNRHSQLLENVKVSNTRMLKRISRGQMYFYTNVSLNWSFLFLLLAAFRSVLNQLPSWASERINVTSTRNKTKTISLESFPQIKNGCSNKLDLTINPSMKNFLIIDWVVSSVISLFFGTNCDDDGIILEYVAFKNTLRVH